MTEAVIPRGGRFVPLAAGFRPMFLLAGLDAVFNMALWLLVYFDPDLWPRDALVAMYWHGHEMLFGFVSAAIGGFLLTAVPGWTGRSSYAGAPLTAIATIWLAGRIAMLPFTGLGATASAAIDLLYFPALALTLAPPLIRARKFRNLPFLVLLTALFFANLIFHLGATEKVFGGETIGLGLGVDIVMILIVVIGGRVIPGFTQSGLRAEGVAVSPASRSWLDALAIGSIVLVLAGDLLFPDAEKPVGAIALIAGIVQAARLAQWQGHRALRVPLVWVLHTGYAWLAIGLLLKGVWFTTAAIFASRWLHAIALGAFATMILAIMTRASLGHTGRALIAPKPMAAAYILINLAAAVRVFGLGVAPDYYDATIAIAGAGWIAAFILFLLIYTPMLTRPRVDGRAG